MSISKEQISKLLNVFKEYKLHPAIVFPPFYRIIYTIKDKKNLYIDITEDAVRIKQPCEYWPGDEIIVTIWSYTHWQNNLAVIERGAAEPLILILKILTPNSIDFIKEN